MMLQRMLFTTSTMLRSMADILMVTLPTSSTFCLFSWSPKGCGVKQKMLSATSVKAIKEVCKGTVEAAIHDKAECDWDNICSVLRIEAKPISRATFGAHDGW